MNCATMAASIVNKNNSFEVNFKVHNIRNINKSKKNVCHKKNDNILSWLGFWEIVMVFEGYSCVDFNLSLIITFKYAIISYCCFM